LVDLFEMLEKNLPPHQVTGRHWRTSSLASLNNSKL